MKGISILLFLVVSITIILCDGCLFNKNTEQKFSQKEPKIVYKGVFIGDTTVPGEQKKDWVMPSHSYCWQLSKNRWMWVFQMNHLSGIDADAAILYQIRKNSPDGQIIKEAVLSPFTDKWDPFDKGDKFFKQQGCAKIFGVPKGATRDGKLLTNNNVFFVTWYAIARVQEQGKITDAAVGGTYRTECRQFRLNDTEDDVEFLTPVTQLRQRGYETGDAVCELASHIATFIAPPIPYNENFTQWMDSASFGSKIAVILYEFNDATGLYEWIKTGPSASGEGLSEPSMNKVGNEWLIFLRTGKETHITEAGTIPVGSISAWLRTKDPFTGLGEPQYVPNPCQWGARVAYLCPDGVLRVFSGDATLPPYTSRNPLFCWDVNAQDLSMSNKRLILDFTLNKDGVGIHLPKTGFAKLSPVFNNRQLLTFSAGSYAHKHPTENYPQPVTEKELAQCGSHYSEIVYSEPVKEQWGFEK